jgi:hypothetical protein
MSRRTRTNVVAGAAIAMLGLLTLAGCRLPGQSDDPPATNGGANPSAAGGGPDATPTSNASGRPLPDICTLLTKDDVADLTNREVTIMTNEGGASSGARYCQWQLSAGQLTVTVDIETRESFDVRNQQSTPVDGIGETAYSLSGHLYVFQNGRAVDVYASSSDSDSTNLTVEKNTAEKVLPKLETP